MNRSHGSWWMWALLALIAGAVAAPAEAQRWRIDRVSQPLISEGESFYVHGEGFGPRPRVFVEPSSGGRATELLVIWWDRNRIQARAGALDLGRYDVLVLHRSHRKRIRSAIEVPIPRLCGLEPSYARPGALVRVCASSLGASVGTCHLRAVGGGALIPIAIREWMPTRLQVEVPGVAPGSYEMIVANRTGTATLRELAVLPVGSCGGSTVSASIDGTPVEFLEVQSGTVWPQQHFVRATRLPTAGLFFQTVTIHFAHDLLAASYPVEIGRFATTMIELSEGWMGLPGQLWRASSLRGDLSLELLSFDQGVLRARFRATLRPVWGSGGDSREIEGEFSSCYR